MFDLHNLAPVFSTRTSSVSLVCPFRQAFERLFTILPSGSGYCAANMRPKARACFNVLPARRRRRSSLGFFADATAARRASSIAIVARIFSEAFRVSNARLASSASPDWALVACTAWSYAALALSAIASSAALACS